MSNVAAAPVQKHSPELHNRFIHHIDPEAAAFALKQEEEAERAQREKVKARRHSFYLAGRLLLAALFVTSGLVKLARFELTAEAMYEAGLAMPTLLLSGAIALEVLGGLLLAAGLKTREAAATLAIYLVAVTLLVHGDLRIEANGAAALSNLAFAGGLLMLFAHGAGTFSLDKQMAKRRSLTNG